MENQPQAPLQQPRVGKLLAMLGILVVVALVGVGAVKAGPYIFKSLQSPEKIMKKMLEKVEKVKSAEYVIEVKGEVEDLDKTKKPFGVAVKMDAFVDKHDADKPIAKILFFVETDEVPSYGPLNIGMEVRMVDNLTFLQLTALPTIPLFDLSSVKNKWVKIDIKKLNEKYGQLAGQYSPPADKLTPEQIKKIQDAFKQYKLYKDMKKLGSENVNGVDTNHYSVAMDVENYYKFMAAMMDTVYGNSEMTKRVNVELGDFKDKDLKGEIWIGKDDYLPYKFKIFGSALSGSKDDSKVTVEVQLKNYNKSFSVEAPAQAEPLENVIEQFLGSMMGSSTEEMPALGAERFRPSSVNMSTDTDGDGLVDYLEINNFKTDPKKADTDGDGINDLKEVQGGLNPNGSGKLY